MMDEADAANLGRLPTLDDDHDNALEVLRAQPWRPRSRFASTVSHIHRDRLGLTLSTEDVGVGSYETHPIFTTILPSHQVRRRVLHQLHLVT